MVNKDRLNNNLCVFLLLFPGSGTCGNFLVVGGRIHSDVSDVIRNKIEAHIRNICSASVQCFCALTVLYFLEW